MTIFLARPEQVGEGIRLAVKDLFDTAGLRTTYGSILFADHVPDRTAEAVARLEAAGYVNVGKTNLHEFAYGITSYNPHFGEVPNPLAPGRTAGGSSAGSAAALAAGLADAALGSDSGGSIRIPAACCGVVGFKPSRGLVPLEGCFPLAPSFDHAGPMGRDVEACARMLEALAPGFERAELGSLEELEVGVAWLELAEPLVRARVQAAAELFPRRRDVAFPLPEGVGAVFMREVAESHRGLFPEHADAYGENVRAKLERCLRVTDAEFEAALRRLEEYRERGIRTLDGGFPPYSLSRRVPSATRPPLRRGSMLEQRALQAQQEFLALDPARVAAEHPAGAQHAVAGHDHRHRVRAEGVARRADRARAARGRPATPA